MATSVALQPQLTAYGGSFYECPPHQLRGEGTATAWPSPLPPRRLLSPTPTDPRRCRVVVGLPSSRLRRSPDTRCRWLPRCLPGPSTAPAKLSRLMLTRSHAQPGSVMRTVIARATAPPSLHLRSRFVPCPLPRLALRLRSSLVPAPQPRRRPRRPRHRPRQQSCHGLCFTPGALAPTIAAHPRRVSREAASVVSSDARRFRFFCHPPSSIPASARSAVRRKEWPPATSTPPPAASSSRAQVR